MKMKIALGTIVAAAGLAVVGIGAASADVTVSEPNVSSAGAGYYYYTYSISLGPTESIDATSSVTIDDFAGYDNNYAITAGYSTLFTVAETGPNNSNITLSYNGDAGTISGPQNISLSLGSTIGTSAPVSYTFDTATDSGDGALKIDAPTAVPEPSSLASFGFGGLGLLGLALFARKSRRTEGTTA